MGKRKNRIQGSRNIRAVLLPLIEDGFVACCFGSKRERISLAHDLGRGNLLNENELTEGGEIEEK